MPRVTAHGVQLFYDERGDARAPVVLLIMGLETQMIAWPEAFCDGLAAAGYRVIRYNNRDVGPSKVAAMVETITGHMRQG